MIGKAINVHALHSPRKSIAPNPERATGPVLVSEGGAAWQPARSNDPVAAWMDLGKPDPAKPRG